VRIRGLARPSVRRRSVCLSVDSVRAPKLDNKKDAEDRGRIPFKLAMYIVCVLYITDPNNT